MSLMERFIEEQQQDYVAEEEVPAGSTDDETYSAYGDRLLIFPRMGFLSYRRVSPARGMDMASSEIGLTYWDIFI